MLFFSRTLKISFPILLIGFITGCDGGKPEQLAAKADAAFKEGRFSAAVSGYEAVMKKTGISVIGCYNLALAAYCAEDYSYAQNAIKQVLLLDPKHFLSRELQAVTVLAQGRPNEAIILFTQLLPDAVDAASRIRLHIRLSRIYLQKNRNIAALGELLNAYIEEPNNAIVSFELGKMIADTYKNYDIAANYFMVAQRFLPQEDDRKKEADSYMNRYFAYQKRNPETAKPTDVQVAEINKNLRTAKTAETKKQWQAARKAYNAAITTSPVDIRAGLALGNLEAKLGRNNDAINAYQAVLKVKPLNIDALFKTARLALTQKKSTLAVELLTTATIQIPSNLKFVELMVNALSARKDFADARIWAFYYLSLIPENHSRRDAYKRWAEALPILP